MGTPDQLLARVAKARAQVERARQRRTAGKAGHADVCAAEARLAKALDAARAGGSVQGLASPPPSCSAAAVLTGASAPPPSPEPCDDQHRSERP